MTDDALSTSVAKWAGLSVQERYRSSAKGPSSRIEISVLYPCRRRLILSDAVMVSVAMAVGLFVRSPQSAWLIEPVLAIYTTPVTIGLLWICLLYLRRSCGQRIIVLRPVMNACAVAVKSTSYGPEIYQLARIGRSGQVLTVLKFRSMQINADARREA